jgi:uncharacterized damage-inducible protein DinB
MTKLQLPRPGPDEAASSYHGYIAAVPDEQIGLRLATQAEELDDLLRHLDDSAALARYAEGKWSIKEVVGHLIDAERIFAYRLLRVSRGDATPLPGFDENAYVPEGRFNERPLATLLAEFRAVRLSTLALVDGTRAECWTLRGQASGQSISARALAYILVGHVAHHLTVLQARYGLRAKTL